MNDNLYVVVIMEKSRYVVFVNYGSDAERKRIEYLLSKWSSRVAVKRPRGLTAVLSIDEKGMKEFLRELLSRLEGDPKEKVKVLRGVEVTPSVKTIERELNYTVKDSLNVVEKFVEYLMLKLNATPYGRDALGTIYEVYTRKGKVTVRVVVSETRDGCSVKFKVSGYGEAVDFLAGKIDDEFRLFAGG